MTKITQGVKRHYTEVRQEDKKKLQEENGSASQEKGEEHSEVTLHSPGNGRQLLAWFPRKASTPPYLARLEIILHTVLETFSFGLQ